MPSNEWIVAVYAPENFKSHFRVPNQFCEVICRKQCMREAYYRMAMDSNWVWTEISAYISAETASSWCVRCIMISISVFDEMFFLLGGCGWPFVHLLIDWVILLPVQSIVRFRCVALGWTIAAVVCFTIDRCCFALNNTHNPRFRMKITSTDQISEKLDSEKSSLLRISSRRNG